MIRNINVHNTRRSSPFDSLSISFDPPPPPLNSFSSPYITSNSFPARILAYPTLALCLSDTFPVFLCGYPTSAFRASLHQIVRPDLTYFTDCLHPHLTNTPSHVGYIVPYMKDLPLHTCISTATFLTSTLNEFTQSQHELLMVCSSSVDANNT